MTTKKSGLVTFLALVVGACGEGASGGCGGSQPQVPKTFDQFLAGDNMALHMGPLGFPVGTVVTQPDAGISPRIVCSTEDYIGPATGYQLQMGSTINNLVAQHSRNGRIGLSVDVADKVKVLVGSNWLLDVSLEIDGGITESLAPSTLRALSDANLDAGSAGAVACQQEMAIRARNQIPMAAVTSRFWAANVLTNYHTSTEAGLSLDTEKAIKDFQVSIGGKWTAPDEFQISQGPMTLGIGTDLVGNIPEGGATTPLWSPGSLIGG